MSLITRRQFATIMGLATLEGVQQEVLGQSTHAPVAPQTKAPAKGHSDVIVDRSIATPEQIWADLMQGNKRFTSGKTLSRDFAQARAKTATSQHPYVAMLCCADSRLSPELIFDQTLGDLFVVRTAGNVADEIALASLEYAVEHLHTRMLVVMGHEKCGAVAATLSGEEMPTENLAALVRKIRPGIERLKGLVKGETLMNLAVEANVHHSASCVVEESPIIRREVASGKLTIVKAVYKLGTGEVMHISGVKETAAAGR